MEKKQAKVVVYIYFVKTYKILLSKVTEMNNKTESTKYNTQKSKQHYSDEFVHL